MVVLSPYSEEMKLFKVNGLAAITSVVLAAAISGVATAATVGQGAVYSCVNTSGNLSKVSTKAHSCPRGTRKLNWGIQGPVGAKGETGANGADGAAGPAGPSDLYTGHGWAMDLSNFATLANLTVPSGSYLATANVELAWTSIGGPNSGVRCEIYNDTSGTTLEFREGLGLSLIHI